MIARRGRRDRIPRAWLIPLALLVALLSLAAAGVLSASLTADLVAWWPVWIGLIGVAWLLRRSRLGRIRVAGLVPLIASIVLATFAYAHVEGWPIMPSAAGRLIGPETEGLETGSLSASIDGPLEVRPSDAGFAYEVYPVRRGGDIALPVGREQLLDTEVAVVLVPETEPGPYRFAGWRVGLSPDLSWHLTLSGSIEADLTGVDLAALQLAERGSVRLGPAGGPDRTVTVEGEFTIFLLPTTSARVIGEARVPPDWTQTEDGWANEQGGEPWLIAVADGASVRIVHALP